MENGKYFAETPPTIAGIGRTRRTRGAFTPVSCMASTFQKHARGSSPVDPKAGVFSQSAHHAPLDHHHRNRRSPSPPSIGPSHNQHIRKLSTSSQYSVSEVSLANSPSYLSYNQSSSSLGSNPPRPSSTNGESVRTSESRLGGSHALRKMPLRRSIEAAYQSMVTISRQPK